MLREEVADHYRAKGYQIRERAQVRGTSGTVHTVEMVAMGPLGNLVIAFEDAGGFEGPEMTAVRRIAKDIGATPVMAARKVPDGLRKRAAEAGVVLLDDDARARETVEAPVTESTIEYPPWPDTAKPAPDDAPTRPKSTDPGIWKYSRDGEAKKPGFDWLQSKGQQGTATTMTDSPPGPVAERTLQVEVDSLAERHARKTAATAQAATEPVRSTDTTPIRATPARRMDARWFWTVVVLGASGGIVFFALSQLL